jgi:hypothetical protein
MQLLIGWLVLWMSQPLDVPAHVGTLSRILVTVHPYRSHSGWGPPLVFPTQT